jgi:type IV pilus assembly protein PilQ
VAKVPLFGDIPIVGNLLKNKNKSSRKQELLIFITPRSITEGSMARR